MTGICYIKRKDIDVAKWDACIDTAENGLIYAYSYYLDAMCDHWDALVLDDYKAVMPLPWRKKWGIKYIYQPAFVNALGVFFVPNTAFEMSGFLNSIPHQFQYCDMDLNEQNSIADHMATSLKHIKRKERNNYFLNLNLPYANLFNNYKRLAKRKIIKAIASGLVVKRNADPEEIIAGYSLHYSKQHAALPKRAYKTLLAFSKSCNSTCIKTYQAYFPNGEVAAFYLLLEDKNYLYSLLGGSTARGKEAGAFYLLTNAAIKDHAGTHKTFRFEGSDIKGIAFFNQQFSPFHVGYVYINYNALAWPFRLFKK